MSLLNIFFITSLIKFLLEKKEIDFFFTLISSRWFNRLFIFVIFALYI